MTDTPASAIACIGWGSLVRDPGELPCRGSWHDDGPALPVEFARESNAKKNQRGDKITLVICPESVRVRTYWISLDLPDLTAARKCLATRERIPKNWETDVGFVDLPVARRMGWKRTRSQNGDPPEVYPASSGPIYPASLTVNRRCPAKRRLSRSCGP